MVSIIFFKSVQINITMSAVLLLCLLKVCFNLYTVRHRQHININKLYYKQGCSAIGKSGNNTLYLS